MDYKKAYEEALERAKQGLPIDEVFHELKESEDERIRKQLIDEVKEQIENIPAPDCCDSDDLQRLTVLQSWLAYLEKQKEQKPAERSEEDIKKIRSEEYTKGFNDAAFGGKLKEWSEEDEKMLEQAIKCVNNSGKLEVSTEEIEDWLISLPEKFNLQPKQEWSEEDENALEYIHELIGFGFTEKFFDAQTADDMRDWLNTRLKSLRPQPHWKPSDEQIRPLEYAIEYFKKKKNDTTYLESLYDDLKKL